MEADTALLPGGHPQHPVRLWAFCAARVAEHERLPRAGLVSRERDGLQLLHLQQICFCRTHVFAGSIYRVLRGQLSPGTHRARWVDPDRHVTLHGWVGFSHNSFPNQLLHFEEVCLP